MKSTVPFALILSLLICTSPLPSYISEGFVDFFDALIEFFKGFRFFLPKWKVDQVGLFHLCPESTENISYKRAIVSFVSITPEEFEIMSYRAVNVAMHWDSFFPVSLGVFESTFFIVL